MEITVPVNGNVQDFWILEQPKLLSVEEALLDIEEEEGVEAVAKRGELAQGMQDATGGTAIEQRG